jgi:crotonobetainyl-CoA:carnitine CoA-transferase CaiB-like acyl-CoA transferase
MIRQSSSITDQLGFSFRLSETPPQEKSPAPALGEHTEELLAEIQITEDERRR